MSNKEHQCIACRNTDPQVEVLERFVSERDGEPIIIFDKVPHLQCANPFCAKLTLSPSVSRQLLELASKMFRGELVGEEFVGKKVTFPA